MMMMMRWRLSKELSVYARRTELERIAVEIVCEREMERGASERGLSWRIEGKSRDGCERNKWGELAVEARRI